MFILLWLLRSWENQNRGKIRFIIRTPIDKTTELKIFAICLWLIISEKQMKGRNRRMNNYYIPFFSGKEKFNYLPILYLYRIAEYNPKEKIYDKITV